MFTKLTETLDSFLELGTPGYDLAVYKDGECIYRRKNGYSDRENKIPMRGDELYYVYSVSKVITVTAALQLYEKGRFSLDDPLSKYESAYKNMRVKTPEGEVVPAKNEITVRDLFRMTAGYNYRMKGEAMVKFATETLGRCPTGELRKYLADAILDFEPGTMWQYSLCHDLLASFVELWSGEKFGEYVRKNIFIPAGMTSSRFHLEESERSLLCPQYMYNYSTKETCLTSPTNCYDMWPEYESGGGGCVSNVEDMIKFGEALRLGRLLKQETIDLMTTNQIAHCMDSYFLEKYAYGLGVRCSISGDDGVSDFGWGGAAGAGLWIDQKNALTVFYAQHVLNSPVVKKRNQIIFVIKKCLGLIDDDVPDCGEVDGTRAEFAAKYGN